MPEIEDAVKFLDENIRTVIVNDVLDVAEFFSRPDRSKQAEYFCVPKLVLTLTEFLGYIAFGGDGEESKGVYGIKFLKNYFGYKKYPNLICNMWRHGTVHRFSPDIFEFEFDGKLITLGWMANNDRDKGCQDANAEAFEYIEKPNIIVININIYKLAMDLHAALDRLIEDVNRDAEFKADCCMRINKAIGPKRPKHDTIIAEMNNLFELYERGELKKVDKNGRPPK